MPFLLEEFQAFSYGVPSLAACLPHLHQFYSSIYQLFHELLLVYSNVKIVRADLSGLALPAKYIFNSFEIMECRKKVKKFYCVASDIYIYKNLRLEQFSSPSNYYVTLIIVQSLAYCDTV